MGNGKTKKNRALKLTAALFVIAAAAGGYYYIASGKTEIQYKTSPVTRGDILSTIQATGTLNPVETVDVGTQISGTIKAELDVAAKNLARTQELARRDLIAKSDVDADTSAWLKAKASLTAAEAKVSQSAAALRKSRINLNYTKIYSPVDGVVVAKNVEEGQTVAASYQTPSIAEIARDLTQMQVEVNVDEADIGGVREGQEATFNVDTYPNEKFAGKVTQVRLSPATNDNVVTYTVVVKVSNPDGKLLPGMTANVSLILESRKDVLTVPNSAFRFKPSDNKEASDRGMPGPGGHRQTVAEATQPAVYRLEKKKPVRVEVEKGITDGQNTEILSGVGEDENVITGIIVPKEGK